MHIFFQLLNIAGVNGHILYNMTRSEDPEQNRRQFLKNLAMGLIKPHMENRALLKNLPVDIKCFLAKYKPQQEEDTAEPPPKVRKRCRLCGRAKNRVTTMRCFSCNDFVCKEHSATEVKCDTCTNVIHVKILQRVTNKHWRTGSGLFSDISSKGELSYLAPVGSENISDRYFKQCFFQGAEGRVLPPD